MQQARSAVGGGRRAERGRDGGDAGRAGEARSEGARAVAARTEGRAAEGLPGLGGRHAAEAPGPRRRGCPDWAAACRDFPACRERRSRHIDPQPTQSQRKEEPMSVKIRLSRGGAKKRPYYYIVVANTTSPRDGRYIEQIGTFNPMLQEGRRRPRQARPRALQALARRRRPADRPRRAPARCRRPDEAHGVEQPREGEAEEEAPGARGGPGREGEEGRRGRCRCLAPSPPLKTAIGACR